MRKAFYTVAVIAGAIVLYIFGMRQSGTGDAVPTELSYAGPSVETSMSPAATSLPADAYGDAAGARRLDRMYRDEEIGYSFGYPSSYAVKIEGDPSDRFVVAQQASSAAQGGIGAFQLESRPWHDPQPAITVERIKHDDPQIDIRDPQPVVVGGIVRGVAFKSYSAQMGGDVRQVWFTVNDRLYQFTAPMSIDSTLMKIVATFSAN
ncbi:MAG: hypothetical protein KGI66_04325 [Patescibacteria group bacterium]|nr:hypothetical protein [Patescibacteria group bacterium]